MSSQGTLFGSQDEPISGTVAWNDLRPLAEEAFSIWVGHPERGWAEQAWTHLTEAGFARADGPLDRLRAYVRFLVLASMYRDWCKVARDEDQEDSPGVWLSAMGDIDRLHVGQLLGPAVEFEEHSDLDEALRILMQREHRSVVAAVLEGFGGTDDLFLALWRSSELPDSEGVWDDGDSEEPPDSDADILNDPTEEKMAGYMWIDQGCESYALSRGAADFDP